MTTQLTYIAIVSPCQTLRNIFPFEDEAQRNNALAWHERCGRISFEVLDVDLSGLEKAEALVYFLQEQAHNEQMRREMISDHLLTQYKFARHS